MGLPEYRDTEWMARAACHGRVEMFFATRGEHIAVREALEVCGTCEVVTECLEYALTHHESMGIWGGKTPAQRARLQRVRRGVEEG